MQPVSKKQNHRIKKKTALWSITSGASFWLNSLHANRAEALCILRECTISFMLIFDLCEWHRLHVHCWFLHGSRVLHTNGISILITNWSVCTGISYWREPSSCNLHEGIYPLCWYLICVNGTGCMCIAGSCMVVGCLIRTEFQFWQQTGRSALAFHIGRNHHRAICTKAH